MDKKAVLAKLKDLSIEEKIAMLSEIDQAFVHGLILGFILKEQEVTIHTPKPRSRRKK